MFDDDQEILKFLIANETFKDVTIDENTHAQSLTEVQKLTYSQIPTILIPRSVA